MLSSIEIYKMLLNGSQWGQWSSYHLPINQTCYTTWTPAGTSMHWQPATWQAETHAVAYFYPGRWYVIHAFYDRGGDFAGCYCDIVMPNPPIGDEATEVRYTDLFIDVVVRADRSVYTKDEEVYARAMQYNSYLGTIRTQAFEELDALANEARAWSGPFEPIAARLTRTDWEVLDPSSDEFVAARVAQWHDWH